MKPCAVQRGFTIIEVLVALAILSTGAFVLTFAFANAVNGLQRQKDNSQWENDLQFVRRQVLLAKNMEELEEGDEIETLSSGVITWEATEIEMAEVIDLFRVTVEYEIEDAPGVMSNTQRLSIYFVLLGRKGSSLLTDRNYFRTNRSNFVWLGRRAG